MTKFTASLAELKAWVLLSGIEGRWEHDSEFTTPDGAKLIWTANKRTVEYRGEKEAVRKLKAALERKKESKASSFFFGLP